jgi:RNA polymerase sigma-70 factor (ECF subfamily)
VSHAWALAEDAGHPVADVEPSLHARLADGERAAIDEVYRTHYNMLRGFAQRLVGDAQTAEDIVHDVFVALPGAIRRFRGESSLGTYLCAIALRRSYRHARSASRRRAAMGRLADEPMHATAAAPDSALGRKQLAAVLYEMLDRLPRNQRIAFAMCEIEQLSAAEAAAIVDVPEATVRTRLFHARRKLRDLLSKQEAHPL